MSLPAQAPDRRFEAVKAVPLECACRTMLRCCSVIPSTSEVLMLHLEQQVVVGNEAAKPNFR
jgi:hypothetical protein